MQLQENQLFASRYMLLRRLGAGGFSEVWLAGDTKTGVEVALKVYAPHGGMDDDGVKVFSSEYSGVFNINHSNLLRPTYYDVEENRPYLVMPYISNGSAKKYIGCMPEEEVWKFIRDVASGLAYMHSFNHPMIHQDIKPDNVMIGEDGIYLITDYGVSAEAKSILRKNVLGKDTVYGGNRPYLAPEYFGKQPNPIKASDVWSLGATVFELMEGDVPFGETGGIMQKSGAEIPSIRGNYSDDLKELVLRCLSEETLDRPTAEQLAKYCTKHIDGENPEMTWKSNEIVDFLPEKKRKKYKWLWILLAAVTSGIIIGHLIWFRNVANKQIKEVREVWKEYKNHQDSVMRYQDSVDFYNCHTLDDYVNYVEKCELHGYYSSHYLQRAYDTIRNRRFTNGTSFSYNGIVFEFVGVRGGTFTMQGILERGSDVDEIPSHGVTLNDYYIGKYEVTQEQWRVIMDSNPSYFNGDKNPVEQVSLIDCVEFINSLNYKFNMDFRLPTEAEWEYAASGGCKSKGYKYNGSNNIKDVAWYDENSDGKTHPVGTKTPNELGIYDMSGNVSEWCQTYIQSNISSVGDSLDYFFIYHGGSWRSSAPSCSFSYRNGCTPFDSSNTLGFRLAFTF